MRIARFAFGGEVRYGVVDSAAGSAGDELQVAELGGHPFGAADSIRFTGARYPVADVRLLAPVLPSKVVAIGKNYAAHAREMGGEAPDEPVIFLKPSTSVSGPVDAIVRPVKLSNRVDYEGELAVVIGKPARNVSREAALEYALGYACANDVTARDQQRADVQFTRAKGYDSFCPLGPWIETVLDPSDLRLVTRVNGEIKQDGRTSQMVHDIPAQIAFISEIMTLLPGDVILTGTPAGVGPIVAGDTVSIEIEGIGTLSNPVVPGGQK
jgi:2-keto-4-pentenoate hydratase/2-oxohepta-3-ene-1,7-dioic acid hydratase in catechol pathway